MSKIDLTSKEWCELVFEGKNKEYGAYNLRQDSARRHYRALIIVLVTSVVLFSLPTLINMVTPTKVVIDVGVTEFVKLDEPPEDKEEEIKPIEPPPPPLKSAIKFTAPVITKEEISKEEEMVTQEEVTESKAEISFVNVEGDDDDPNAVSVTDQLNAIAQVEKIYDIVNVEQMPQYPGGEKAMREFLQKNLRYPTVAAETGIEGKVFVRFIISKTGEVISVEVTRSVHPLCDKEAIRVIQSMPKWIPGKNNGNAVSVIYSMPVVFKLAK